jgi:hypothetical protein
MTQGGMHCSRLGETRNLGWAGLEIVTTTNSQTALSNKKLSCEVHLRTNNLAKKNFAACRLRLNFTDPPAMPPVRGGDDIAAFARRALVTAGPPLASHVLEKRNLSVRGAQGVTLGVIAAYVVGIALLWNLPYVRWVLWPFKVSLTLHRTA